MAQQPLLAGKYRLLEPLGRGAMGVVWSAVNSLTEREVAIKLLANADDEQVRIRLMREARACGRIQHPNVIEIFDVDATATREPFLVMQLLKGETLAALLQREAPPLPFALRILRDMARRLAAAHKVDVVHRDLKPANIFLHRQADSPDPVVKILDFGVSRISTEETMTLKGLAIGSPAYMAPEQALGQKVDARTDMWTFGTVTYFVLTGRLPFAGRVPVEFLTAIVKGPIPVLPNVHPLIDADVRELVARCFERDIAARSITAAECASILDTLHKRVSGQPASAPSSQPEASPLSVTNEGLRTAVVQADDDAGAITTSDSTSPPLEDDDATLGRIPTGPRADASGSFRPVRKTVRMEASSLPLPAPRAAAQHPPSDAHGAAQSALASPSAAAPSAAAPSAAARLAASPMRSASTTGPVSPVPRGRASLVPLLVVVALVAVAGVAALLFVLLSAPGRR